MTQKARWERYKKDTVQHILASVNKDHLLTQCSSSLLQRPWAP